jgi:hypothetical protein
MKVFGTMFDSGYPEDKCTKVVEKNIPNKDSTNGIAGEQI